MEQRGWEHTDVQPHTSGSEAESVYCRVVLTDNECDFVNWCITLHIKHKVLGEQLTINDVENTFSIIKLYIYIYIKYIYYYHSCITLQLWQIVFTV